MTGTGKVPEFDMTKVRQKLGVPTEHALKGFGFAGLFGWVLAKAKWWYIENHTGVVATVYLEAKSRTYVSFGARPVKE